MKNTIKKALAVSLALGMVGMMAGCSGSKVTASQEASQEKTLAESAQQAVPEAAAAQEVNPTSGLVVGPKVALANVSYNDKTMDELYEEAKKEGGTITVYSITAKVNKVAEAFQKAYPDLKVEAFHVSNSDMATKVPTEADAGRVTADVVIASDATGQIYQEWYEKGYVEAYYPSAVTKALTEDDMYYAMPLYSVMDLWYYNCKDYPEAPLTSWWDMLETDESGKYKWNIYIQDVVAGDSIGIFTQLINDSDALAKAYENKYGKPLEYTYDASILGLPENNAGYEFIYRLAQTTKLNLLDKGDDRVLAVHNSTGSEPVLANTTGAKRSKDLDNNWGTLAWITNMEPYACYLRPTYVYLTGQTDNPSGARLFSYFALGGDDPGNSDGLAALLGYGSWSQRSDWVSSVTDVALSDINYGAYDLEGVYNNYRDMCDAWIYWFDKFHS